MRATKYNKSEIMKQAWMMFQNKFFHFATFGEALKMAWNYAKRDVAVKEQAEARKAAQAAAYAQREANKAETKQDRFYKSFGKTIARQYRNVTFGKNDYQVAYGRRYY